MRAAKRWPVVRHIRYLLALRQARRSDRIANRFAGMGARMGIDERRTLDRLFSVDRSRLDDIRTGLAEECCQDRRRVKDGPAHRRTPAAPRPRDLRLIPRRPSSFQPAVARQAAPVLAAGLAFSW